MATTMKTPAEKIQKLEEEYEELQVERRAAKEQLRDAVDEERTRLNNRIENISLEMISINNQITAILTAQQQGKFLLSFSLFHFFLNNIILPISHTYCDYYLMYRLDRFGSSSAIAGKYFRNWSQCSSKTENYPKNQTIGIPMWLLWSYPSVSNVPATLCSTTKTAFLPFFASTLPGVSTNGNRNKWKPARAFLS